MTFLYSMEQIFVAISSKDLDGISSLLQLTQKVYVGVLRSEDMGLAFYFRFIRIFLTMNKYFMFIFIFYWLVAISNFKLRCQQERLIRALNPERAC